MREKSDNQLIQELKEGQLGAFDVIVQRYQKMVTNFVYQMVGDPHATDDICQETFINAYKGLQAWKPGARFSTWLLVVAKNACFDHWRRARRHQADSLESVEPPMDPNGDSTPESAVLRGELGEVVQSALRELHFEFRAVVVLRELLGFSYREIAEIMSCPVQTVGSRLSRAHQLLRGRLVPYFLAGAADAADQGKAIESEMPRGK